MRVQRGSGQDPSGLNPNSERRQTDDLKNKINIAVPGPGLRIHHFFRARLDGLDGLDSLDRCVGAAREHEQPQSARG